MVEHETKKRVEDCLEQYSKLKDIFQKFCNLCREKLSSENPFNVHAGMLKNNAITFTVFGIELLAHFLLKKRRDEALPIG